MPSRFSDDHHWLAYSTDATGFRQYTLYLMDLWTGATLPERRERVASVAWAADNQTLFYTIEDEITKRSYRLDRHVLGSSDPDPLLYEETDERFHLEIERTRSGGYLLLTSASHTASEVRFLRAADPFSQFRFNRASRGQSRVLRRPPSRASPRVWRRAFLYSHKFG